MKNHTLTTRALGCVILAVSEWAAAQSGMASLRVRCDGDSLGTGVSINGQFKGECPFDAMVPEGTLKIEARKPMGKEHERVFEQEMRVGAGIIKSIEVVLGREQLTAEAKRARAAKDEADRRAQAEREAQQQREQEARQAEQQRQAAEAERQRVAKFERLRTAAEGGDAEAMTTLAAAYEKGQNGVPRDRAQAFAWYRKAAEMGNPAGMAGLGTMYFNGWGAANDYIEAERWFRKAALAGDGEAMYHLSYLYYQGWGGLPEDTTQDLRWLQAASDGGHAAAQLRLGVRMMQGDYIPKDPSRGMALLVAVADQRSDPEAFARIGNAYAYGWGGTPKNEAQAQQWYRKGIELGCVGCLNDLAILYETGKGGLNKDVMEATKLYRRAADLDDWTAMGNLARLSRISRNQSEALHWFRKAVEADIGATEESAATWSYKLQVEESVQPAGGAQGLFCFATMNVSGEPGHRAVMSTVWQNAQPDGRPAAQQATLAQFIDSVRTADAARWHDFSGIEPVCGGGVCYRKAEKLLGKSHQASQFCHPVPEHLLRMRARFMRLNTETISWIPPGARQR